MEEDSGVKEITLQKIEVPDHINYIFLKYKLIQARINKAIGMNEVAHEICNHIMLYVRQFQDMPPSKFWLTAVKAAQIQSVQLCNAKEYEDASKLLRNVG